jgi:ABC-2 type transport system permease protein
MTLLNVERIKLFSTRSPYWCLALIVVIGLVITLVSSLVENGQFASLSSSQQWVGFGQSVVMVMAALAITTEYRFGTIRTSFLAAPGRTGVMIAKAGLVALLSLITVWFTSALTYLLAKTVHGPGAAANAFDINGAHDWQLLWAPGVLAALSAVLAVGVGALVRQSAGAIAILLLWPLLVENLFLLFGEFGRDVQPWLPFSAGSAFANASDGGVSLGGGTTPNALQGGLVFAGTALLLFVIGLVVVKRRDA